MAFIDYTWGDGGGLNRAKDLALRAIARDAPPWVGLGGIPLDSVLVGEAFFADEGAEPWAFDLTEGERSQVRLVDEPHRMEQADTLRGSHAVANQPAWAQGLTRKERELVDLISGNKAQYAAELRAWRRTTTDT